MSTYADNEYLFTSESVGEGHPDKVADQISDGVLDAVLAQDSNVEKARVACETLVNTGLVVVSGEIRTDAYVDIQQVAREACKTLACDRLDLFKLAPGIGCILIGRRRIPLHEVDLGRRPAGHEARVRQGAHPAQTALVGVLQPHDRVHGDEGVLL